MHLRFQTIRDLMFLLALTHSTGLFSWQAVHAQVAGEEPRLSIAVGDTLAPFLLPRYGGNEESISLSDYCGPFQQDRPRYARRPVLLWFFTTSIDIDSTEFPTLERQADRWGSSLKILLIASGERPHELDAWYPRHRTSLTILRDPWNILTQARLGINIVPTTVLLTEDAVVEFIKIGYTEGDEDSLVQVIDNFVR